MVAERPEWGAQSRSCKQNHKQTHAQSSQSNLQSTVRAIAIHLDRMSTACAMLARMEHAPVCKSASPRLRRRGVDGLLPEWNSATCVVWASTWLLNAAASECGMRTHYLPTRTFIIIHRYMHVVYHESSAHKKAGIDPTRCGAKKGWL